LILDLDSWQILLKSVLEKTNFWKKYKAQPLNARQIKMFNKLLDDFKKTLQNQNGQK
jgi:hypothetical protein